MRHLFAPVAATAFSLLMVACGGGGSDAGTSAPTVNPNAFPSTAPIAGDYYVYTLTSTPTLPAGQVATQRTVTRAYRTVASDGASVRLDTFSALGSAVTRNYGADRSESSLSTAFSRCDFAPSFHSSPLNGSVVGDKYASTSKESCVNQQNGSVTTYDLTATGTVLAAESHTIASGTFSTIKFSDTVTTVAATGTSLAAETCWVDIATGRTVDCTSTYAYTPTGQTAPTSTSSGTFELTAYSFNGGAPVGPAERRFAGTWAVTFAGGSAGSCAALAVDTSARVSGTCQFVSSTGTPTAFTVNGNVTAAGAATVTASTGALLVGTFNSPSTASGTWTNGAVSGTWTATHQ